nr:DUF1565 domain-containing protein [Methanosarcina horonobensis]
MTIQDQNSVTMKGFNITGAGTNYSGIYVLRSPNCVIEDNILHNDGLGVYLKTSNNNIIRNNTASKNLLIGTVQDSTLNSPITLLFRTIRFQTMVMGFMFVVPRVKYSQEIL